MNSTSQSSPIDSKGSSDPGTPNKGTSNGSVARVTAALNNSRLPCYVDFDVQSPIGVLILTLRDHINRLGREQTRHKRETTSITMMTVSLSAISTVLLGLSFKDPADVSGWLDPIYLKNAALVFTALITVVNAYEALFKPHRLWVREGKSYGLLKDVLLKLELRAARAKAEPVTNEEVEVFRAELAKVLGEDLEAWVRQHGEDLITSKPPANTSGATPPSGATSTTPPVTSAPVVPTIKQ